MRYTLLVLSPPDTGASARHALEFAKAVCLAGHHIACVFFYDAGVLTALAHTQAVADEDDLRAGWQSLAQTSGVRLLACVASAQRFGIGDGRPPQDRCAQGFSIAGLGELIEASTSSQRFLTFAD
ncbi:MAG: sulfurtransferase complex subunit TusD [Congregibacter sp.]|nr:sulfurtransferase complex subunit TusD [Congregibacter sp.]MDP5070306.1 sulfurtransferase complex subunit TusD [Congregibacter sp.]